MKKIFFFLALAAIAGGELLAQQLTPPRAPFMLNLDYARFRNDAQSGYLEIYYAFYPNLLHYNFSENAYRAGIKLNAKLVDKATQAAVFEQKMLLPVIITDTSSAAYRFPLTTQTGHVVPFGEYTLTVAASDSLNPAQRDSLSLPLSLKAFSETVAISDLELCSRIQSSSDKEALFFKNSLEVIPNPALVFGVATHPMLFNYVELYNLNPATMYMLKSEIVASDGRVVKEAAKTKKYTVKNGVEVGSMVVTAVPPGRYTFRLSLLDENAYELARSEKTFFTYNPHLQAQASASGGGAVPFQAVQLSGLSAAELDAEFQHVKYVATGEEIKMYAQIQSETGKREFLARFWAEVEAGRLERAGVKRTEYLRRVAAANQHYTFLNKEGWRTDRGRVLILYGDPDHVVRVPSEGSSKPYQTWYYYGLEKGAEFIFVDRLGNGDFQLVHSTKRGELQDENWQSYLQ
ncbi:GWxTD domain-containing protein [candidate division KSB1 bacterium]|nr:GWxTD domain-containing protein [candidate division KSB1 bacterium]